MKTLELVIASIMIASCAQKEKSTSSKVVFQKTITVKEKIKSNRKPAEQINEDDALENIGAFVKVELLQKLNVKPNTQYFRLQGVGAYQDARFELTSVMNTDRYVEPQVYTIVDIRYSKSRQSENSYYDFITVDLADNENIREIVFKTPIYSDGYHPGTYSPMTVGEFKRSLQKYFKVIFPLPAKM